MTTPVATAPTAVLDAIEKSNKIVQDTATALTTRLDAVEKKLNEPQRAPWVTAGPVGEDSKPYSILRAMAFCDGRIKAEQAKNEIDLSNRLKSYFGRMGW